MKKWLKICLIVLCVLVALDLMAQLFCLRVNPLMVDRIELYTYDHTREGRVVLNEEEASKVVLLYNLSMPSRRVDGQPCCDSYRLEVYFKIGTKLFISEGTKDKLIISTSDHYVSNKWLLDYILKLVEKYELPID